MRLEAGQRLWAWSTRKNRAGGCVTLQWLWEAQEELLLFSLMG